MENKITHNSDQHRFEMVIEGHKAFVEYKPFEGGFSVTHTYVSPAVEGRGIAALLMKEAIMFAKEGNLKVRPVCSYAVVYFEHHPDLKKYML